MTRIDNKPLFRNRSAQQADLLTARARLMRSSPTASERLLWSRISGRQLGVVFRRQVPLLGRFVADFLAPAQRLVVEVDGTYHVQRGCADARRDAVLARAGYCVVRIEAELVLRDLTAAIERVRGALKGV